MNAKSLDNIKIPTFFYLIPYLLSVGCSYTSKPLYEATPAVQPTPQVKSIAQRAAPDIIQDQLTIHIPHQESLPSTVSFKALSYYEKNPSIVINVPVEMALAAKEEKLMQAGKRFGGSATLQQLNYLYQAKRISNTEYNQKKSALSTRSSALTEVGDFNKVPGNFFKTIGYFNKTEQEIEKSLMRIGFNVLDRSKFEAQLKDLRDSSFDNTNKGNTSSITDEYPEEIRMAMDVHKKRLEKGLISTEEYIKETKYLASKRHPTKVPPRQQNEIIDITEVIRAVQKGKVKADYLLQINELKVVKSYDRQFSVSDYPEAQSFLNSHQGLKFGNGEGNLKRSIPMSWFRAEFNAKLIHIKTGSIVWIGNHTVYSPSAETEGASILFNVERYASNVSNITSSIDSYNKSIVKATNLTDTYKNELDNLYIKANEALSFDTKKDKERYEENLKQQINQTKNNHLSALNKLTDLTTNEPASLQEDWDYKYKISDPVVKPLLVENVDSQEMKEKVFEHKINLIKKVTSSLIGTIQLRQL